MRILRNRMNGFVRRFAELDPVNRASTIGSAAHHKLSNGQSAPFKPNWFVGGYCRGRFGIRIHGIGDARALRHRACRSLGARTRAAPPPLTDRADPRMLRRVARRWPREGSHPYEMQGSNL